MADSYPGAFAGKIALRSAAPGVQQYYLTICCSSDVPAAETCFPGMNAESLTFSEEFLLYRWADGYYRIQSSFRLPPAPGASPESRPGDALWLVADHAGAFLRCGTDPSTAAAFELGGQPVGSQLNLRAPGGDVPIYYMYHPGSGVTNMLGAASGPDHYATFAMTTITPGLDALRQAKRATKADLADAILLGQDLSQGIDFTGASFRRARLPGANLKGAILDAIDLTGVDLAGVNWGVAASARAIQARGALGVEGVFGVDGGCLDCTGADFTSANLAGARLIGLRLDKANFSGANLSGATFAGCSLDGAMFTGANLVRAVLDGCSLLGANLDKATALGASFARARLADASAQMGNFTRAVFDNADLARVRMGATSFLFTLDASAAGELDRDAFPQPDVLAAFAAHGAGLQSTSSVHVVDPGRLWQIDDPAGPYKLLFTDGGIHVFNDNPSLAPAILREASCVAVTAPAASMSGADLRGVRWHDAPASLAGADLQDAAFTGADLHSTDFTQANLAGADFSGSVLLQSNFTGCVAGPGGSRRAIAFEDAHLEGARFAKATFAGALLTGALVSLDPGVPLFTLPPAARVGLAAADAAALAPTFQAAGFSLGAQPDIEPWPTWSIDNRACQLPSAPRIYRVVSLGAAGVRVSAEGRAPFTLQPSAVPLLGQPSASQLLVSAFAAQGAVLAPGAPITACAAWMITPDEGAGYVRAYRFDTMAVQDEEGALRVYGLPLLYVAGVPGAEGVAFGATENWKDAFNANSIGPGGMPFAWLDLTGEFAFLAVAEDAPG